MKQQGFRLAEQGLIDRSRPLRFQFDGKTYSGYQGDTLASALLANGVTLFARSFKYHRPRGVIKHDSSEPNALVTLGDGARREPNIPATVVQLYDGLTAYSQNCWPGLKTDLGALNNLLSPLFAAGFYYKTFIWPRAMWTRVYEPLIRRVAGLGKAPTTRDPDRYEKCTAHCDVLVVGAGVSGIMAALAAASAGCRVILCDENPRAGGMTLGEPARIDDQPADQWISRQLDRLRQSKQVELKLNITVLGYYDDNTFACVECGTDYLSVPAVQTARQKLWRIIAAQAVIATGALERMLLFNNNDRPGVMTASAVRQYIHRYGVKPGNKAVVFGNNDDIYHTATCLIAAGVDIADLIDTRPAQAASVFSRAHIISDVKGHQRVSAVLARPVQGGAEKRIDCDMLVVAGGWDPALQLVAQRGEKPVWDENTLCFLPANNESDKFIVTGSAAGVFRLKQCIENGWHAGRIAADKCGYTIDISLESHECDNTPFIGQIQPYWGDAMQNKAFVDFQHDVTQGDVLLAHREGYRSIEHIKRYTTLGMATDQGKSSNVNALGLLSAYLDLPISTLGTTTFRPPYTPVSLGALAGYFRSSTWRPERRTPLHDWLQSRSAVFVESGLWLRSQYFPRPGESMQQAVAREVLAVRKNAGCCDISTLGKIDLQGPDAAEFLNRVYCNGFKTLAVGKSRYGLMLREDGIVFDDGTVTRFAENRYFITTTTARSDEVMAHLEYCHQVLWPHLNLCLVDVSEDWAALAVCGPASRTLVQQLIQHVNLDNTAFPHLSAVEAHILEGTPVRVLRISFSGELGYELYIPSGDAETLIRELMNCGEPLGLTLYGEEALDVMRIEKGHVSSEIDGATTAHDLGLGRMMSNKKDYIGRNLSGRPGLTAEDRQVMVGLKSINPQQPIVCGAHLIDIDAKPCAQNDLGYVTSSALSPVFDQYIALALVKNGRSRIGDTVKVCDYLSHTITEVEIVSSHFYDPGGERQNA